MFSVKRTSEYIELSYDKPRLSFSVDFLWDIRSFSKPWYFKKKIDGTTHVAGEFLCFGVTYTKGTQKRWWTV